MYKTFKVKIGGGFGAYMCLHSSDVEKAIKAFFPSYDCEVEEVML